MKALKGILNFFGVILAIILSIALILVLLVTPVVSIASGITKPEVLQSVVSSIDYEKLLEESGVDLEAEAEKQGIPVSTIQSLAESDAVKDVLELYSEDIGAILNGEQTAKKFTPEAIKGIINENIDEIGDIAFEIAKEEEPDITKEEIKTAILEEVDTGAEEIAKLLPPTEELIDTETMDVPTLEAVKVVFNGTLMIYVWVAIAVLSLLIYGCRFMRFKGFMWLAVIYILGALAIFGLRGGVNVILDMVSPDLPFSIDVIMPALNVVLSKLVITAIVLLALAIAYITVFVLGRKHLAKRQAAMSPFTGYTSYGYIPQPIIEETTPETADNQTEEN